MSHLCPRTEFLVLSKLLCGDCRKRLDDVEAHHALMKDELVVLSRAIGDNIEGRALVILQGVGHVCRYA